MPGRIQMRRTKGWRKPPGAIYVGRPGKWGNPYRVGDVGSGDIALTANDCARMFPEQIAADIADSIVGLAIMRTELRGHDLACWCPLDRPCHADVLLELANA